MKQHCKALHIVPKNNGCAPSGFPFLPFYLFPFSLLLILSLTLSPWKKQKFAIKSPSHPNVLLTAPQHFWALVAGGSSYGLPADLSFRRPGPMSGPPGCCGAFFRFSPQSVGFFPLGDSNVIPGTSASLGQFIGNDRLLLFFFF